jgi:hypothetical protein
MATLPAEYREGWPEENAIYRTARKRYRCTGNGPTNSPGCTGTIAPGDHYVEYVGDVPAYQRGSTVCMPCALAFEYIRHAEAAPAE